MNSDGQAGDKGSLGSRSPKGPGEDVGEAFTLGTRLNGAMRRSRDGPGSQINQRE